MRSVSPRGRGRRTWPQRLVLSLNVVLVLAALATAAGIGYSYDKVGSIPRVSFDEGVLEVRDTAEGVTEAINVLLVGTDSTDGIDPDDPILRGRPATLGADVIMVLRLEPDTGAAALLSIPRDLWVPIAGEGSEAKINSAYTVGGPPALVETITDYLDIPIHHFVAVDFAGFREVVAAIGGVEMYFRTPVRDPRSGLIIEEAGCRVLDADMALAYARSRKLETFEDGRWRRDNLDDWGRMQRQQEFMRLAMARAIDRGARNPATLNAIIEGVLGDQAVILDDQLTTGTILEIAMAFRLFNPGSLGGYGLRDYVDDEMKRGQAALVLRENEAQPLLDLFRGTQGLDPTPETVRVRVLNGSGVPNQATEVAADLRLAEFVVRSTDNARVELDRTEVRYAPGQRASAELLARYLAVPPELIEDRDLTAVPVVLATGADYTGLLAEPRDPGTTERPSTTTSTDTVPGTTAEVIDPDQPDEPDDAPPPPAC